MRKRTAEAIRLANAKYNAANPDKQKARALFRNAIKAGRILPQPCEKCGDTAAEAHHDDYSKPLEVKWFCKVCHGEYHQAMDFVGKYVILPDGTPDKIELHGWVAPPPGYEVHRYFPSPTGWTTVVKRIKTTTSPQCIGVLPSNHRQVVENKVWFR